MKKILQESLIYGTGLKTSEKSFQTSHWIKYEMKSEVKKSPATNNLFLISTEF